MDGNTKELSDATLATAELYFSLSDDDPKKEITLKKWDDESFLWAMKITSPEGYLSVYWNAPEGGLAREFCKKRFNELANSAKPRRILC